MDKRKLLAWYIASVIAASLVLIVIRWNDYSGLWGIMDLVSASIWQAVVWPLYLLLLLVGNS